MQASAEKDSDFQECLTGLHDFFKVTQVKIACIGVRKGMQFVEYLLVFGYELTRFPAVFLFHTCSCQIIHPTIRNTTDI